MSAKAKRKSAEKYLQRSILTEYRGRLYSAITTQNFLFLNTTMLTFSKNTEIVFLTAVTAISGE